MSFNKGFSKEESQEIHGEGAQGHRHVSTHFPKLILILYSTIHTDLNLPKGNDGRSGHLQKPERNTNA
jgi:hypothetical protein